VTAAEGFRAKADVLDNAMAPTTHRSRIHLLAAKNATIVVILQRERAKLFHGVPGI
jgi:hypothetical protein